MASTLPTDSTDEGRSRSTPDDLWRYVWCALAEYSACDDWGGAECRRVTAEWIAAGRPCGIAEFIISKANEGSGSVPTA